MKSVVKSIGVEHVVLVHSLGFQGTCICFGDCFACVDQVDQVKIGDMSELDNELKRVEGLGGEGLMLRQPGSKCVECLFASLSLLALPCILIGCGKQYGLAMRRHFVEGVRPCIVVLLWGCVPALCCVFILLSLGF